MKTKILTASAATLIVCAIGVALLRPDSADKLSSPAPQPTTRAAHRTPAPDHRKNLLADWQPLIDDTLSREERLDIARGIRPGLSEPECAFLFDSLSRTPRIGKEQDWWVVMNEIMEQMRKNGVGADAYTPRMIALIQNPASHNIVRDYAIQHLAQWIAPAGVDISPGEPDPQKVDAALQTIASVVSDPLLAQSTASGTALMAIVDASSRLPEKTTAAAWQALDPFFKAAITGSDPAIGRTLRISAIQAAGIRRIDAHLPAIRTLATQETADPSVRLSSIAALGFYADPADRPYLESLSSDTTQFRHAAQAALARSLTPVTR